MTEFVMPSLGADMEDGTAVVTVAVYLTALVIIGAFLLGLSALAVGLDTGSPLTYLVRATLFDLGPLETGIGIKEATGSMERGRERRIQCAGSWP